MLKLKAIASLLSGCISGILIILGGVIQLSGQAWGLILATVVTAVLVVVFVIRLTKTRKFMPAGLMTILGVAARSSYDRSTGVAIAVSFKTVKLQILAGKGALIFSDFD